MMSTIARVAVVLAVLPTSLLAFSVQRPRTTRAMSLAQRMATEEEQTTKVEGFSQELMDEASDALTAVGWAAPSDDEELTSEDPFVKSIDASIQRDMGVSLDELLNPAKVG